MVPVKVNNPTPHPEPEAGALVLSRLVKLEEETAGLETMINHLEDEFKKQTELIYESLRSINSRLCALERSVTSNENDIRFLKEKAPG